MALAFKRAVTEAEKAVEEANKYIQATYKTTVNPALVVDFEGIKAVAGESDKNSNSVVLPKNITLVNWVKDYVGRFHSVWGDIQYKDKNYALPILLKHLDKVVLHVDDKSPKDHYNSYATEWKGKDLHITVSIDFHNSPQTPSLADEKRGHVIWQMIDHLDAVGHFTFELRKANMIGYEYSPLVTHQKALKDKTKKDIPLEIDWNSVLAVPGKAEETYQKPPVPNNARAIYMLGDGGKVIQYTWFAVEKLCKDQMGLEAFIETFDKVVIACQPGIHDDFKDATKLTKEGKTLKFAYKVATINVANISVEYNKLASQIEAML